MSKKYPLLICCDNNKCEVTKRVPREVVPVDWLSSNISGKWKTKFRPQANFCSEKCRQEFFAYWGKEWTHESVEESAA